MNVSNSSFTSSMMQQMQKPPAPPSDASVASKVFENSDTDGDSLLTLEELGIDEDTFNSMDSDGDGSLNVSELTEGITEAKANTSSPEEFGEFLSTLGLEVPPPPPSMAQDHASKIASDLFSSSDSDSDGLLTLSELGIDEELFNTIDSDEDGQISQEELEDKLLSMFDDLESGDMEMSEFAETMASLGAEMPPPPPGGAMQGGGAMASSESSSESYEAADTNQDGTVSASEYAAYYGSASEEDVAQYTLDLMSSLIEAIKEESGSEDVELSQVKDLMKMVNDQIQDPNTASLLNTYVSHLSSSKSNAA